MKRGFRLISDVVIVFIISVCLTGCWDSHELNKIAIIAGLGWDLDPDTGEVSLTYQTIDPSKVKSSASAGGTGEQKGSAALQSVQLDHTTASSPYEALNRLTQHTSRLPFFPHTLIDVFGKDAVQQGIYPFLDSIVRNAASRPLTILAVSEKNASDILEIQDGMESIQAAGMVAEIKLSAAFSKYPVVTLLEFSNRLMSKTTAPIAPIIGFLEETGPEGQQINKIRITGTAVFKGDRMIGELNERESRGLLWAINKIQKGFMMVQEANLEIVQGKSKIVPELQGDKIKITLEIEGKANLIEYHGHQDITTEILQELEKGWAKEIESEVRAVIEKSVALNADVFGFGDAVHRKYKKEWKDLKLKWDQIYPGIEVVVNVKTHLNENGDISKALMKDTGEAGE